MPMSPGGFDVWETFRALRALRRVWQQYSSARAAAEADAKLGGGAAGPRASGPAEQNPPGRTKR